MTTKSETFECPCGRIFWSARGLRAHQSARFVSMSCRPIKKETETVENIDFESASPWPRSSRLHATGIAVIASMSPTDVVAGKEQHKLTRAIAMIRRAQHGFDGTVSVAGFHKSRENDRNVPLGEKKAS